MFSPRHATSREWFRAGFFSALGVAFTAILAYILWQFSAAVLAICLPFILGLILAILLDPLVDWLERRHIPRLFATITVYIAVLALLFGFFYALVPRLIDEAGQLKDSGPQALDGVRTWVNHWLKHHKELAGVKMPASFDDLSAEVTAHFDNSMQQSIGGIQGVLQVTAGAIIDTLITLVVGFFLLKDIDTLRARFFYLLPERARGAVHQVGRDIGGVLTSYLRNLFIICVIYATCTLAMLYALSLTHGHSALAGYVLLIAAIAGVLYAVPYIGSFTTGIITFLVAFTAGGVAFAFWCDVCTLILNQVFDNIITPRVVGGGVGLHPVGAIFALFVGAELFHVWGVLLAVPVAACLQVIMFRIFPQLTTKTPAPFLYAQGVPRDQLATDSETSKVAEGDHPEVPHDASKVREIGPAEHAGE